MFDFKILLAIIFLYSLIIPLSIRPVSGLYDIGELTSLRSYCFLHADRPAQGENVVNDLITAGLANSTYHDWSCAKISETLQAEEKAESERLQAEEQAANAQAEAEAQKKYEFTLNCIYGNLTPSQIKECYDADLTSNGPHCLYDEEDVGMWYTEDEWNSGRYKLTPEELSECKDKGYLGSGTWANYGFSEEDEDKDTKESDK